MIKKYKDGTASEKEMLLAKSEIEKFEAIEEFLMSSDELGFGIGSEQAEDESILSEETKKIKSNVNKKLRKTVICSVLVVMAIFGGIFFVVSPIMDSLYYNPASKNLNPEYDYQNINCDINVITELNMPEKTAIAADADRLGFARYDATYTLRDPFSGKFYDFHSKISSGKSTGKYDFYKKALEYAEQNKVKSYGVLVYGEAKDILEFAADENVYSIEVRDVKVSKFSK